MSKIFLTHYGRNQYDATTERRIQKAPTYVHQEDYEMDLQINSKLVHFHRVIIKCISRRHNLHFYGHELFALLWVFYNLQSFKRISKTMKGGGDLEEQPTEDKLSSFLRISKSFTVLPAMPGLLGASSRQEARKLWLKDSSGGEEPQCKSDQVGARKESHCLPERRGKGLSWDIQGDIATEAHLERNWVLMAVGRLNELCTGITQ